MIFPARLAAAFMIDTVGLLIADAGGGSANYVAILFNYGVLGVVTILWLLGKIETPRRAEIAEARATAAETRERAMQDTLRNEVVPALVRFTDTATRILERDGRT